MAARARWKDFPFVIFLYHCIIFDVSNAEFSATCGHIPPKPQDLLQPVHLEPAHIVRKRSINQQLRIKIIYDRSFYNLSQEKASIINITLPAAIHYWEQTLQVRPMRSSIVLSRKCEGSKMFYKKGSDHAYCMNSCEPITKCGEVEVPEEHLDICRVCDSNGNNCRENTTHVGEGITDADFVFYVSAIQTDRCHKGLTIAYAAHCQLEAALDRPVAGHANLCPEAIFTKSQDKETLFSTMKHEILHALGFSVSLFAYYRDKNGNPLTERGLNGKPALNETLQNWQWSDKVIQSITRPNWLVRSGEMSRTVHMIVTPRVVEEVRRHFNCPTLEGAELENQGGEGTELTHWEKRIFENEAMTGIHTQNPVYSRMTLALLEDTGWYMPNYDMAEPLTWGQSLGCDFVTNSCLHWMKNRKNENQSIYPFCDMVKKDPLYTSCSEDRTALTVCNLIEYSPDFDLPKMYQNFESLPGIPPKKLSKYGGSLMLADYCPFFQEFHWKTQNVSIRGSKCIFEENRVQAENNVALEDYGNTSKCFNHAPVPWEEKHCLHSRHKQHYGSGCYKYSCAIGKLHIIVLDRSYTCSKEDELLHISIYFRRGLHSGYIKCPACSELCKECITDNTTPQLQYYMPDQLICAGLLLHHNIILIFTTFSLSHFFKLILVSV